VNFTPIHGGAGVSVVVIFIRGVGLEVSVLALIGEKKLMVESR
jgi:hypothetical protein